MSLAQNRAERAHKQAVKRSRAARNLAQLTRLASEDPAFTVEHVLDCYVVRYGERSATYWPSTGTMKPNFGDRAKRELTGNGVYAFLLNGGKNERRAD